MSGPDRATLHEQWFETPFGRRADRFERLNLSQLLAGFKEARTLLDVGCGTGHFFDLWESHGFGVVGLDVGRGMLGFAHERHPSVPIILGDAACLPFVNKSFDVVALITVLEFLPSPTAALREAIRVARRGVLLGVLNSLSPVACWRRVSRSAPYRRARFYSQRNLEYLVRDAAMPTETSITSQTGLYPVSWLDRFHSLRFGAFIGMRVTFKQ